MLFNRKISQEVNNRVYWTYLVYRSVEFWFQSVDYFHHLYSLIYLTSFISWDSLHQLINQMRFLFNSFKYLHFDAVCIEPFDCAQESRILYTNLFRNTLVRCVCVCLGNCYLMILCLNIGANSTLHFMKYKTNVRVHHSVPIT